MKLSVNAKRLIERSLRNTSFQSNLDNFKQSFEIPTDTPKEKIYEKFLDLYNDEISTTKFRLVWKMVELSQFLGKELLYYETKSESINFKSSRRSMKRFVKENARLIAIEISSSPQIILLGRTYQNASTLMSKMSTDRLNKDEVFWLPEESLIFSSLGEDEAGTGFREGIEEYITGPWKLKKLQSMDLTAFFTQEKTIEKVKFSAVAEITGFNGLNNIQFNGDDVKKGVYGLQQRQEVDVRKLSSVGPSVEIASHEIHLFTGNKIKLKSISGIMTLKSLLDKKSLS